MKNINDDTEPYGNYMDGSGKWVSTDATNPFTFDNPKLLDPPKYSQTLVPTTSTTKVATIPDVDFDDYARQLLSAFKVINKIEPDVIFVPRRGAVRLWRHLCVLCGMKTEEGFEFPYTGKEQQSDETIKLLDGKLASYRGRDKLKIVCIDAADGGQGSGNLLNLLESIHASDPKSQWVTTFCLFVPKKKEYAKWQFDHKQKSKPLFQIDIKMFGVSQVIGEDLKAAMISSENFGKYGQISMKIKGQHYLIETMVLPAFIDQKIAEAIHNILRNDPTMNLEYIY